MIVIASVVLLLILVGGLVALYFMNKGDKGGELIITDEGSSTNDGSKKEGYIQIPNLQLCTDDRENKPDYCSKYEFSETAGYAYAYDLSLADVEGGNYEECVGGGHDCWYTEQYDQDGTLVGVVDKDGVSLLDKIADDVWSDKWSEDAGIVKFFREEVEYKDGKLIAKKEIRPGDTTVNPGETVKPGDVPMTSLYFIVLFSSMKLAGAEKPSKITLKIKNAKNQFDTRINRTDRPNDPGNEPSESAN